jgi:Fe-S cluster assembly iron-binding protein IscA
LGLSGEVEHMLMLTEDAAATIRSLMDRHEMPAGCGLRVAGAADGGDGLAISATDAPEEGDAVVESDGARVFVDPGVAPRLEDKVLDAGTGDDGRIHFRLLTT